MRRKLTGRNLAEMLRSVRPDGKESGPVDAQVRSIVEDVRTRGDEALIDYTAKFDGVHIPADELRVGAEEFKDAWKQVTAGQIAALRRARVNLVKVEQHTLKRLTGTVQTSPGVKIQAAIRPLDSVGCYVPGGRAVYPSSLLMNVVPAQVAGVGRIVICSPPSRSKTIHPLILAAAKLCGVDEVYRVGGAQAIAALAYGTRTIRPVQKIIGPGSAVVAAAKIAVSQQAAIDSPAGPTELLIIADESANPTHVAVDLISQAEHGGDSCAGLVTTSEKLAREVLRIIRERLGHAERADVIAQALAHWGFVFVCDDMKLAVEFANEFAPEHLEIMTKKAGSLADKIRSAGMILLGNDSPVAVSDYAAGSNHVLPTGGTAKVYSGLSAVDFVKRVNIVQCSREGLRNVLPIVKELALAEGLPNHYLAVAARIETPRKRKDDPGPGNE